MFRYRMEKPTYHVLTLSLLLAMFTCTFAAKELDVTVHSPVVTVVRGDSRSLDGMYTVHYNDSADNCTVVSLFSSAGESICGDVEPSRYRCEDAAPVYTHYGCLAHYETLNFQVYSRTADGKVASTTFSISVHVTTRWPSLQLAKTSDKLQSDLELVLKFSDKFTAGCYYSITTDRFLLPLPASHGRIIHKQPHHLMPCGYSSPFQYTSLTPNLANALLVRTMLTDGSVSHHVLPITSVTSAPQLPGALLQVHELSETPLPADLLPVWELVHEYVHLEFTFPVLSTGGFYSVYSAGNLDATTFTWADVQNNAVAFRPREEARPVIPIVTRFHYLVSDVAGQILAEGYMEVTVTPRIGHMLSLRKNIPLTVEHGDSSEYSRQHLDFYPPGGCSNFFVTVNHPPQLGGFVLDNGMVLKEGSNFSANYDNFTLEYVHNDSTSGLVDHSVWTVRCRKYPPLSIVLRQIIAPRTQSEHHLVNISHVVLADHASLLDLSSVKQCDISPSILTNIKSLDGQVLQWKEDCPTPLPLYPYIESSAIPSCLVQVNSSSRIGLTSLWYLPSEDAGNTTHLSLQSKTCTIAVQLSIVATPPRANRSGNVTGEDTSLPYLRLNRPLPLTTPQPVHISREFLYVHSVGYLQKEINYRVSSPPRHGHLCYLYHLECSRSLSSFTQEDLLANKVYYKPLNDGELHNDSFEFHVSCFNDTQLPGEYVFQIRAMKEEKIEPHKLFWVAQGRTKALSLKYLRHFDSHFKPDPTFTVVKPPRYGHLELPVGKTDSFTWDDAKNRLVKYHHNREHSVCSDSIQLMATDGRHIVYSNLTIAIRLNSSIELRLVSHEHRLSSWNHSFVLSSKDLVVKSGFCSEFVRLSVNSTPSYGVLMERDPTEGTTRHLAYDSTFTASALEQGLITYFLKPDVALMNDAHDSFLLFVEDPGIDKNHRKRDVEATSVVVRIYILEINNSIHKLNFTFASPKYIGVLESGQYGTVFGPNDIKLISTDIQPVEVDLTVLEIPQHGHIERNGEIISEFSLDQFHRGEISYISTLEHFDTNTTTDQFRFMLSIRVGEVQENYNEVFRLAWCYFTIANTRGHTRIDELDTHTADFDVR